MMKHLCIAVFACLLCLPPIMAEARVVPTLVPHPVTDTSALRSPGVWRSQVGTWGEQLVDHSLRQRGFEVHEIKLPGNHGIDRIAIRWGPNGALSDLKFVEVKTHRGTTPRLGQTRHGQQMSRKWLADHLRAMHRSPNTEDSRLAREISRFIKGSGKPITHFGELHELNTRTGRYIRRDLGTLAKFADDSIVRHLSRIQRHGGPAASRWATRSLAAYDAVAATRMVTWLTLSTRQQATRMTIGGMSRGVLRSMVVVRRGPWIRIVGRTAGPVAIVLITALEVHELVRLYDDYRCGLIDHRTFVRQASRVIGGFAGAMSGAAGGGAMGMWIGTFGGPVAWITVPAGGVLGGTIGSVVGYFAGSWVGGTAVDWYHSSLDEKSKAKLSEQLLVLSWSELEQLREATSR